MRFFVCSQRLRGKIFTWREYSFVSFSIMSNILEASADQLDAYIELVDGAMQALLCRGKTRLRLDCWDGNSFLKAYYRERGFRDMGRAQEEDYRVRLFERDL